MICAINPRQALLDLLPQPVIEGLDLGQGAFQLGRPFLDQFLEVGKGFFQVEFLRRGHVPDSLWLAG